VKGVETFISQGVDGILLHSLDEKVKRRHALRSIRRNPVGRSQFAASLAPKGLKKVEP
jgi:hypothetical protein